MATTESTLPARYMAAWNDRDVDAMADLLTDDIVWHDPALAEPARGIPAVQEFMRASFHSFPDLRFSEPDAAHYLAKGDRASWAWVMEGTMRGAFDPPGFAATGRPMRVEGVDLWVMRGDRIAHYQAFYDVTDLARQLGIMPPRGSAAERAMVRLQRVQARLQRR